MSHIVHPHLVESHRTRNNTGLYNLVSSVNDESVWLNEFMVIKIYLAQKEISHIAHSKLNRKDKIIKMIQSIVDHFKMGEKKFYEELMIKAPGTYSSVLNYIKYGFTNLVRIQLVYGIVENYWKVADCSKQLAEHLTCTVLDAITDDNLSLVNCRKIVEDHILTETASK